MIAAYVNRFDEALLTTTSSVSNFPVQALQHIHLANQWYSAEQHATITMSFNEPVSSSAIILSNHNFDLGATLTLSGSDDFAFTSPTVITSIMPRPATSCIAEFDSAEFQYYRLIIENTSSIVLGRIFLGHLYELPPCSVEYTYNVETTSNRSLSLSGQLVGNRGLVRTVPALTFENISEDERLQLMSFYNSVHTTKPLWLIPFRLTLDEYPVLYCAVNENTLQITRQPNSIASYTATLSFTEVF